MMAHVCSGSPLFGSLFPDGGRRCYSSQRAIGREALDASKLLFIEQSRTPTCTFFFFELASISAKKTNL